MPEIINLKLLTLCYSSVSHIFLRQYAILLVISLSNHEKTNILKRLRHFLCPINKYPQESLMLKIGSLSVYFSTAIFL